MLCITQKPWNSNSCGQAMRAVVWNYHCPGKVSEQSALGLPVVPVSYIAVHLTFQSNKKKIKIWNWKDTVQMFAFFFFFLRNRSTINSIFQISWIIKQTIGFCLHEKLHFIWVDANVASAIIKMYFKLQVYDVFSFWQYGRKNHLLAHFFTCSLDNLYYGSIYYNTARIT